MSKGIVRSSLACLGILLLATLAAHVVADEMKKPATQPAAAGAPSAADMAAIMEKVGKTGPQHEQLKKYAGDFKADVQMWMDPSQPAMKSTGKQHNEMALGDRYLMGNYEGDMMGKPFHGMSCTGYDNTKKAYFSAWIDDMSTGMMVAEGKSDADGKAITMGGEMLCPMNNQMQKYREVTTFTDDDSYHFEMFVTGPDGKEAKSMDIVYTRVK